MSPAIEPGVNGARLGLRPGDWVEVKSADEILATLDEQGCLEALPFMPEMLQYCGRRFQVFKSAHKACDTLQDWKTIRRMSNAVHLTGLRCDGSSHGKCQAACLLFWKEAWLKPVAGPAGDGVANAQAPDRGAPAAGARCDRAALERATRRDPAGDPAAAERFRCQATEMLRATTPARHDLRLYVQDLTSGNVGLWDFLRFGLLAGFNNLRPYPYIRGLAGEKTPGGNPQDLQPGDWVEVRSKEEILRTLNRKLRHRGLFFDVEMLPFCGKRYRIRDRVERLLNEKTGEMMHPRNACFILEGVMCGGCLSRNRMFCPRSIFPYWHEIWLRRVEPPDGAPGGSRPGQG
jgi:hypothetical protein